MEKKVGGRQGVSKRLEPRRMAWLKTVLGVAGYCSYRENQVKKPEERTRWQRYGGAQCGFDELLKSYRRIDGEKRRKGRRSASRSFLKMMMVPHHPTSLSEKRSTAWFLSLKQSNECSYSGPSQNSEIFAELEEKDKEILALKEQNKKILDFM
ncbi:unnamed protein product, partial [Arabidopsis halleri]